MGRALRFPVEETYSSGIRETRRKRGCRAVTRSFNIAYRFARVRHFRKARRACLVKSGGSSPRGLVSKEHLARMKRPSDPRDTDGDAKSSRRASNATGDGRRFCDGIYFILFFFLSFFIFRNWWLWKWPRCDRSDVDCGLLGYSIKINEAPTPFSWKNNWVAIRFVTLLFRWVYRWKYENANEEGKFVWNQRRLIQILR